MKARLGRLVAAACLALLLSEWLLFISRPLTTGMGQDFTTMYAGAVQWLHGVNPYQHPELLPAVARKLGVMQQGVVNSPILLLVDAPLTTLAPRTAYLIFIAIQSALLVLSVHLLVASRPATAAGEMRFRTFFWSLVVLCSPLAFLVCYYGQIAGFIAAALSLAIYARSRGRYGLLGAALGLTILKPQLAVLAFPLLWGATRRTWAACAAVVAAYAGIIAWELSPAGLVGYIHVMMLFSGGRFATASADSLGFTSLYRGWLPHGSLSATLEAVALLAPLAAGLLVIHGACRARIGLDRTRVMLALLAVLAMPYTHQYDAAALIPIFVVGWWALCDAQERSPSRRHLRYVYAAGVLLVGVMALAAVSVVPIPLRLSSIGLVLCVAALGSSSPAEEGQQERARAA